MAHLSALGTADPTTKMHAVDAAAGGPTLGDLVVDGVTNLAALQVQSNSVAKLYNPTIQHD
jgi:hypothetical protein